MRGLGTIVNVACIVLGGACGLLFGKKIKVRMQETLLTITGVAVLFLGVAGALEKMLVVGVDGALRTNGAMMMIISLAIGAVIGELLDLDAQVERFGTWLKVRTHSEKDDAFVGAFVSASCTVCIGAMAIVGSIEDGIAGDYTLLVSKGILDAIIICIMCASQGKGCIFSAIPVALLQGGITAVAAFAGSFLPQAALDNLSLVGSVMIFCVGANLVWKQLHIRVANLLPGLIIAAVWAMV